MTKKYRPGDKKAAENVLLRWTEVKEPLPAKKLWLEVQTAYGVDDPDAIRGLIEKHFDPITDPNNNIVFAYTARE